MKSLLLLALLAATSPASPAQEVAPTPIEMAQIDPAARDLLARTQAHYQKFRSFESLISWEIGPSGVGLEPRRFRVQMTRDGQFVAGEELPDKSWRKAIFDGETLVEFRSKFPRTYTRKQVKFPDSVDLNARLQGTLRSVGSEGPLISLMLTDLFGAALLELELKQFTLQDDGALKTVTFVHRAAMGQGLPDVMNEMKLWIDPQTLTLVRAQLSDEKGVVFTESYAQTRFNPAFDDAMFRAAAPIGYQLVRSFETGAMATAPVPAAIIPQK